MINSIPGLNATISALNAERVRMDVISNNIANAETTRDVDGQPFQRRQVVFEAVLDQLQGGKSNLASAGMVNVARIEKDTRPPRLIYNPEHPDRDEKGFVAMPNIHIHEEMADLMTSSRAFEANLAVIRMARSMAAQTLAIGKR